MDNFIKATKSQVEELTAISKAAFDTDISVGANEVGGPPEYDSVTWHYKMQRFGNLYALLEDDIIVGGALLFREKKEPQVLYIGRIFVAPQYHRKGYGIELMHCIEQTFSDVQFLRLETPVWNVRTYAFYGKCGFHEMYRDNESVYFEKRIVSKDKRE